MKELKLLDFSLKSGIQGFTVRFLVTSQEIKEPILGYNVIEQVVSGNHQKEHLSSCLTNTCHEKVEAVISLIQERSKRPDLLEIIKVPVTVKISAGSVSQIRCKVKIYIDNPKQTIHFIQNNNDNWGVNFFRNDWKNK